jgi:nitrate/nitrite transporter NarK
MGIEARSWLARQLVLGADRNVGRDRRHLRFARSVLADALVFLTGTAAAGAIALINAIGNLGGYVGPFVVGWIKDSTNSFEAGLYFLAACALLGAVITFFATEASGGLNTAAR